MPTKTIKLGKKHPKMGSKTRQSISRRAQPTQRTDLNRAKILLVIALTLLQGTSPKSLIYTDSKCYSNTTLYPLSDTSLDQFRKYSDQLSNFYKITTKHLRAQNLKSPTQLKPLTLINEPQIIQAALLFSASLISILLFLAHTFCKRCISCVIWPCPSQLLKGFFIDSSIFSFRRFDTHKQKNSKILMKETRREFSKKFGNPCLTTTLSILFVYLLMMSAFFTYAKIVSWNEMTPHLEDSVCSVDLFSGELVNGVEVTQMENSGEMIKFFGFSNLIKLFGSLGKLADLLYETKLDDLGEGSVDWFRDQIFGNLTNFENRFKNSSVLSCLSARETITLNVTGYTKKVKKSIERVDQVRKILDFSKVKIDYKPSVYGYKGQLKAMEFNIERYVEEFEEKSQMKFFKIFAVVFNWPMKIGIVAFLIISFLSIVLSFTLPKIAFKKYFKILTFYSCCYSFILIFLLSASVYFSRISTTYCNLTSGMFFTGNFSRTRLPEYAEDLFQTCVLSFREGKMSAIKGQGNSTNLLKAVVSHKSRMKLRRLASLISLIKLQPAKNLSCADTFTELKDYSKRALGKSRKMNFNEIYGVPKDDDFPESWVARTNHLVGCANDKWILDDQMCPKGYKIALPFSKVDLEGRGNQSTLNTPHNHPGGKNKHQGGKSGKEKSKKAQKVPKKDNNCLPVNKWNSDAISSRYGKESRFSCARSAIDMFKSLKVCLRSHKALYHKILKYEAENKTFEKTSKAVRKYSIWLRNLIPQLENMKNVTNTNKWLDSKDSLSNKSRNRLINFDSNSINDCRIVRSKVMGLYDNFCNGFMLDFNKALGLLIFSSLLILALACCNFCLFCLTEAQHEFKDNNLEARRRRRSADNRSQLETCVEEDEGLDSLPGAPNLMTTGRLYESAVLETGGGDGEGVTGTRALNMSGGTGNAGKSRLVNSGKKKVYQGFNVIK